MNTAIIAATMTVVTVLGLAVAMYYVLRRWHTKPQAPTPCPKAATMKPLTEMAPREMRAILVRTAERIEAALPDGQPFSLHVFRRGNACIHISNISKEHLIESLRDEIDSLEAYGRSEL